MNPQKEDLEKRKLLAFCRYLRKNPEFFQAQNLHQLMLDDQSKHVKKEEKPKEEKIELPQQSESNKSEIKIEENKGEEKPKEEKKEKKKRVKKEKKVKGDEVKLEELPKDPLPLERQQAQSNLIEPGPVQEEKNGL